MIDYDPLSESATLTGLKCVVAVFVCLALTALPSIQLTIGNQLGFLATGLSNMAKTTTNSQY